MKVVYKKPVLEQLSDALKEAEKQGKTIERFELTRDELWEMYFPTPIDGYVSFSFFGIPVVRAG